MRECVCDEEYRERGREGQRERERASEMSKRVCCTRITMEFHLFWFIIVIIMTISCIIAILLDGAWCLPMTIVYLLRNGMDSRDQYQIP